MFVLTSWGLNLSSSLFGQTWRCRQKNTAYEHREGIRSSLFLSENIFFLVSSHSRHFSGVCEGPIHYLPLFLRETAAHMASCVVCVFMFICAGLKRLSWTVRLLAYIQRVLMHLCTCEWVWVGVEDRWVCVHTCICLLLFIACSIFCIT